MMSRIHQQPLSRQRTNPVTWFCLGLFMLVCGCGGPVGNPHVPEPAKAVELSRYLGKWYEIARYENSFEKGCDSVTALYRQREDGLISVTNSCMSGGKVKTSEGTAKMVADSHDAKLKVSFFGPFYVGNYWVLDHARDYSWSIVGEPSGRYLWILSRTANPDPATRNEWFRRARELGYDTSLIRVTRQTPPP